MLDILLTELLDRKTFYPDPKDQRDHNEELMRAIEKVKGKEARVELPLKLSGTIIFEGKSLPARSTSGFIDKNKLVEIVGIEGFEMLVKRKTF